MRVAMVGAGYVGLVSGACFADFGHQVACVDTDGAKIAALQAGDIPIYEPDLDRVMRINVAAQRLVFTTDLADAVAEADAVFIAVGTPSRRGDGHADLSYVYAAARDIAAALTGFTVVITKSTIPRRHRRRNRTHRSRCPPGRRRRRRLQSRILARGRRNSRFQAARSHRGRDRGRTRPQSHGGTLPAAVSQPVADTSRRTAELIKYAANAFLATKITFINELADLCEQVGADVQEVARGIGADNRIGSKFLHAGPGFGGSCFPKDALR